MKLFEIVSSFRTLFRERDRAFAAMTANDHGVVIAFGESHYAATSALERAIRDLRKPLPEELTEQFGPRTESEWWAERQEHLK